MRGSFEGVEQASHKYSIVRTKHVHDIKGYVFCARVFRGAK
jgi:hypothetical protein